MEKPVFLDSWLSDLGRVVEPLDPDAKMLAMDRVGGLASVLGVSSREDVVDGAVYSQGGAEDPNFRLKLNLHSADISVEAAINLSFNLASKVTFGDIPRSILLELENANTNGMNEWILLLHEHFGEEVLDILMRLLLFNHPDRTALLASMDDDRKRTIISRMQESITLTEETRLAACRWAIGPRLYAHLAEGEEADFRAVLDKLKELFMSKELFRYRLLQAIRSQQLIPDHLIMGGLIHPAMMNLMDVPAVGDFEWNTALMGQIKHIAGNPDKMGRLNADSEKKASFERRKMEVEAALADADASSPVPLLRERLDCMGFRAEIDQMRADNVGEELIAQRQLEFIAVMANEIGRFDCRRSPDGPSEAEAFPSQVVQSGKINCFSGPWLIFSLLVHAGFNERHMYYCNVNRGFNGIIGGHGSLWIRVETGEAMIVDSGFGYVATPFRQLPSARKEVAIEWKGLWKGEHEEPVRFEIPPELANEKIHPSFQIMHAMSGFATGHLLHVGNTFLNEDNLQAALFCYELGLKRAPRDPDLWFGLGLVRERMKQFDLAALSFRQALAAFEGHQHSRFALARLLFQEGKREEACALWRIIVEEKGSLFLHPEIVGSAQRLLEASASSLQDSI